MGLSKTYQSIFLKDNYGLIMNAFFFKVMVIEDEKKALKEKNDEQEDYIKRIETREKLKQSLVNEATEEKVRYVLEKHVVKPQILKKQGQSDEGNVYVMDMEHVLRNITLFMGRY